MFDVFRHVPRGRWRHLMATCWWPVDVIITMRNMVCVDATVGDLWPAKDAKCVKYRIFTYGQIISATEDPRWSRAPRGDTAPGTGPSPHRPLVPTISDREPEVVQKCHVLVTFSTKMTPCGRTCNSTCATWPRVWLTWLIHLPTALIWCSWRVPFLCHTAPSAPTYHFQGGSPLKHVATWHVRFICPKVGECHVVARHLVHTILKYFQNLTWKFLANWIWKIFVEIPIGFNPRPAGGGRLNAPPPVFRG